MSIPIITYGLLFIAIIFETFATAVLEKSDGLSHVLPIVFSLGLYGVSFAMSAYVMKTMPVGIMYALWCGLGTVLIGVIGYLFNKQILDAPALLGMALIAAGIIVIFLCSKSVVS